MDFESRGVLALVILGAVFLGTLLMTSSEQRIGRLAFFGRYLASLLGLVVVGPLPVTRWTTWLILMAIVCAIVSFFVRESVYRLQDLGWSKWLALLYLLPPFGAFLVILLLFWPGKPATSRVELSQFD